jgi:pimeloyl-ACP methyl ester carboxylesterase
LRILLFSLAGFGVLILATLGTAFWLIASLFPKIEKQRDVFGFESLKRYPSIDDLPPLKRYSARDGEELAYRAYDSVSERILIFIHGSSYHGVGYHALAAAISKSGAAKVILPNLRGHFQSGRRRGDIDYIGQYEDDIADLINFLGREGFRGAVTLGGHSSGGGLCIRFAGGPYRSAVSSFLLLSPIIPVSPSIRKGTAGGWASLHRRRLYGLLVINAFQIHAFDGLPIVEFNKPAKFWDGTETLTYSYRLNASYHPRYAFTEDLRALGDGAFAVIGADDEAIDAEVLRALFAKEAPQSQFTILPNINHFGVFSDAVTMQKIVPWLTSLPPS